MVNRLHPEVPGHELHNRLEAIHRRPDSEARKAVLRNRGVNHTLRAKLIQEALGDLVRALILGDLFPHQIDRVIGAHFLRHRITQRIAHRHFLGLGKGSLIERRRL